MGVKGGAVKSQGSLQGFAYFLLLGIVTVVYTYLMFADYVSVTRILAGPGEKVSSGVLRFNRIDEGLSVFALVMSIFLLYSVVPSSDLIRLDVFYIGFYRMLFAKMAYAFIAGVLYTLPVAAYLFIVNYPVNVLFYLVLFTSIEFAGDIAWIVVNHIVLRGRLFYVIAVLFIVKFFAVTEWAITASLSSPAGYIYYVQRGSPAPLLGSLVLNLAVPLVLLAAKGEAW